eukprot:7341396-Heterocapsa_arctica.AAC.1
MATRCPIANVAADSGAPCARPVVCSIQCGLLSASRQRCLCGRVGIVSYHSTCVFSPRSVGRL